MIKFDVSDTHEWQECKTGDNVFCPKCGSILMVIPIARGLATSMDKFTGQQQLGLIQQTFGFCNLCGKYYVHVPKEIQPAKSPLVFPHRN